MTILRETWFQFLSQIKVASIYAHDIPTFPPIMMVLGVNAMLGFFLSLLYKVIMWKQF